MLVDVKIRGQWDCSKKYIGGTVHMCMRSFASHS